MRSYGWLRPDLNPEDTAGTWLAFGNTAAENKTKHPNLISLLSVHCVVWNSNGKGVVTSLSKLANQRNFDHRSDFCIESTLVLRSTWFPSPLNGTSPPQSHAFIHWGSVRDSLLEILTLVIGINQRSSLWVTNKESCYFQSNFQLVVAVLHLLLAFTHGSEVFSIIILELGAYFTTEIFCFNPFIVFSSFYPNCKCVSQLQFCL